MTTEPQPLSAEVLLAKGSCCGEGCRNCPYVDPHGEHHVKGSIEVAAEFQPQEKASSSSK